jgi:hypothetical protein
MMNITMYDSSDEGSQDDARAYQKASGARLVAWRNLLVLTPKTIASEGITKRYKPHFKQVSLCVSPSILIICEALVGRNALNNRSCISGEGYSYSATN